MTMTGQAQTLCTIRRKLKPSIFGISRSRVITSGFRLGAIRSASLPLVAIPTTSVSPALESDDTISSRLRAESSTTSTLSTRRLTRRSRAAGRAQAF
jgi:hypothetical protein